MKDLIAGRRAFWASVAGVIAVLIVATEGIISFANVSGRSPTPTVGKAEVSSRNEIATPTRSATATLVYVSPTPAATPTPALKDAFDFQPLAVMIDNQDDARPQSGLIDADVVYEAVTEAGITRFMAVFANKLAPVVGPIRSARHYFIYWASEYNAIYVHAGASPQGYVAERDTGISRIDYTYGEGSFWRSSDRDAPHNLYASTDELRNAVRDEGKGSLGPLSFKADSPASTSAVEEIVIIHPDGYRVGYVYDKGDNSYQRYMLRQPHVDALNGVQYHPKNVIVQFVSTWRIRGDTAGRVDMELIGDGPAYFFLDGKAIEGSWRKNSPTSPTVFLNENGDKVTFNAGQTWIQVVPSDSQITYK